MHLAPVVMLAGCAVHMTTAAPSELAAHAPAFAQQGYADLVRRDGNVRVSADERVTVHIEEGEGLQRIATMTVKELVAGCVVDGPDQGCLARRSVEEPVLHHRERHFDGDRLAQLVGISAIAGIVGYCAAACQNNDALGRGFAYAGGFIGGTFVLLVLASYLGGHD